VADAPIRANTSPPPNPAIPYLSAIIVIAVIASFAGIFGYEIVLSLSQRSSVPDWITALHQPITALATLVGGVVAVAFSTKPPAASGEGISTQSLSRRNLTSLGQFLAPSGKVPLKQLLGIIYATVYVVLGFAAIGTYAYRQSCTPPDVKSLASIFAGMIAPIVMGYFS